MIRARVNHCRLCLSVCVPASVVIPYPSKYGLNELIMMIDVLQVDLLYIQSLRGIRDIHESGVDEDSFAEVSHELLVCFFNCNISIKLVTVFSVMLAKVNDDDDDSDNDVDDDDDDCE